MKVAEKIPVAQRAIRSISRHDDAEAKYIDHALDQLSAFIQNERNAMRVRREAKWRAELAQTNEVRPS